MMVVGNKNIIWINYKETISLLNIKSSITIRILLKIVILYKRNQAFHLGGVRVIKRKIGKEKEAMNF